MGFTQLSKVLTTPAIAMIERSRGYSAPFNAPRLLCLMAIHCGVFLARVARVLLRSTSLARSFAAPLQQNLRRSVADVSVNRTGTMVAFANVVVTARYKTEWSSVSREHIARKRANKGLHERTTEAQDELLAVRELVETTLPWATLALVPPIAFFEGDALRHCYRTMDARAYGRLCVISILGAWTSSTGYIVIGRLSALTHQILGQFKMCCLLLGSYLLFGAKLNAQQLSGASITMGSVLLYTRCTIAQRTMIAKQDKNSAERESLLAGGAGDRDADKLSPVRIRRSSSLRRPANGHAPSSGPSMFASWGWGKKHDPAGHNAPKPAAFVA